MESAAVPTLSAADAARQSTGVEDKGLRRRTRSGSSPERALSLAGDLGNHVTVVFGYAPPGIWGGEIAEHEEAIEELGQKVTGEARHLTDRPVLVVPAHD